MTTLPAPQPLGLMYSPTFLAMADGGIGSYGTNTLEGDLTMNATTIPQLYGPDGVPLAGPVTTAAYYADLHGITTAPDGSRQPMPPAIWRDYRDAAASEGELWAHALREGRAMLRRAAANPPVPFLDMDMAATSEQRRGIPATWIRKPVLRSAEPARWGIYRERARSAILVAIMLDRDAAIEAAELLSTTGHGPHLVAEYDLTRMHQDVLHYNDPDAPRYVHRAGDWNSRSAWQPYPARRA